jgi:hypothetical protein
LTLPGGFINYSSTEDPQMLLKINLRDSVLPGPLRFNDPTAGNFEGNRKIFIVE